MHIEEIRYSFFQFVSEVKKTMFGYKVRLLIRKDQTISVGTIVYIDTDAEISHSSGDDKVGKVYRLAVGNWTSSFYRKTKSIELDKSVYNKEVNGVWAWIWIKTKSVINKGDICYISFDKAKRIKY